MPAQVLQQCPTWPDFQALLGAFFCSAWRKSNTLASSCCKLCEAGYRGGHNECPEKPIVPTLLHEKDCWIHCIGNNSRHCPSAHTITQMMHVNTRFYRHIHFANPSHLFQKSHIVNINRLIVSLNLAEKLPVTDEQDWISQTDFYIPDTPVATSLRSWPSKAFKMFKISSVTSKYTSQLAEEGGKTVLSICLGRETDGRKQHHSYLFKWMTLQELAQMEQFTKKSHLIFSSGISDEGLASYKELDEVGESGRAICTSWWQLWLKAILFLVKCWFIFSVDESRLARVELVHGFGKSGFNSPLF